MKASISAEDDQYIGVDVTDNQQVEHDLTLKKKTDEIVFHDQDGYADKAVERTNEGGKHVGNARRYAQWYVYRQRGYDTMPALENPDRVTLVALVVSAMDTGPFEEYFGDLYQQLRSHSTDVEPIVPIPDLDDDETLVYQQDVYLGIDQEALDALADDLSVETVVPVLNDLLNWSGETGTSLLEQMDRSSEVVQEHGLDAAGPDLPPGEWIEQYRVSTDTGGTSITKKDARRISQPSIAIPTHAWRSSSTNRAPSRTSRSTWSSTSGVRSGTAICGWGRPHQSPYG